MRVDVIPNGNPSLTQVGWIARLALQRAGVTRDGLRLGDAYYSADGRIIDSWANTLRFNIAVAIEGE